MSAEQYRILRGNYLRDAEDILLYQIPIIPPLRILGTTSVTSSPILTSLHIESKSIDILNKVARNLGLHYQWSSPFSSDITVQVSMQQAQDLYQKQLGIEPTR